MRSFSFLSNEQFDWIIYEYKYLQRINALSATVEDYHRIHLVVL